VVLRGVRGSLLVALLGVRGSLLVALLAACAAACSRFCEACAAACSWLCATCAACACALVVLSDGGTPGGVHGVPRVVLLGVELGSSLVVLLAACATARSRSYLAAAAWRLARGPIWRRRATARSRSYLAAACDGSLAVLSGGGVHGVPLVVLTHPLVIVGSSSEGFLSGVLWFSASKHPARIGLSLRTVHSLAFHLDSGRVVPLEVLSGGVRGVRMVPFEVLFGGDRFCLTRRHDSSLICAYAVTGV
jgi:hypothetical protein